MDNATSHLESLKDAFSHLKVVFLPKNVTNDKEFQSMLQKAITVYCSTFFYEYT